MIFLQRNYLNIISYETFIYYFFYVITKERLYIEFIA